VFCIKPKDLPKDGNACEIHAHGGAAVLGHAEMYNKAMAEHACKKSACCSMLTIERPLRLNVLVVNKTMPQLSNMCIQMLPSME